jgi:uncharacterized Zn-finger protein
MSDSADRLVEKLQPSSLQSKPIQFHVDAGCACHGAVGTEAQDKSTCSHCDKAFKRKGDLVRHEKTHGLTMFYCVFVNCSRRIYTKGFYRKDKLMDHLQTSHKMTREDARYWVLDGSGQATSASTSSSGY